MKEDEKELMLKAKERAASLDHTEIVRYASIMKTLTPEEEIFCKEFAATGDRRKAIVASGYDGKYASNTAARWLAKGRIQDRLNQLRSKVEARLDISKEIYLQMLQETYERAMADGDYAGANRAAELMGKSLGYLVEQKAILNVKTKIPEDRSQRVAEVQRLAKIAGVTLE